MAILLTDNFNVDLSKWQVISGTWTIESGELSGIAASNSEGYILSVDGTTWTDYELTSDLWVKSPVWNAGLVFRVRDANNHYLLAVRSNSFTGDNNIISLYKRVAGAYTALAGVPKANLSIPDNTKVTISIRVIGTSITVYVNGKNVLSYTDSTFSAGKVGCRVYNSTHAHFDNLSVISGNESILNDFPSSITVTYRNDIQSSIIVNCWNAVTALYSVTPVYKLDFPSSISISRPNDISSNFLINAWNAVTALYEVVQPPIKHIHVPCIADALLREAKPTQNFGSAVTLSSGYSLDDSARLRSLLKFDVASVTPGLSMTQAVLRIYSQGKPTPPVLQVYQVLTDWTEYGVTWNGQPGIRFIPEIEVEGNVTPGYIEFDITQLFGKWYSGQYPNYGVLLRLKNESLDQIPYYSREYPNSDQKPEIVFYYKTVATPARMSLGGSIAVRRKPVSDLPSTVTSRLKRYSDTNGNLTVLRADTLRSTIKVHRDDTLECDINVSQPAVLQCSISAKQHYTLFGNITVNVEVVSEVKGIMTVHNPDTLPCDITVHRDDTLPCSISVAYNMAFTLQSSISARRSLENDLSGTITARKSDGNTLSSSISIKSALNEDFSSSMIISKKEISGAVNVVYRSNADLSSSISARRQGIEELSSSLLISKRDMLSTANIKSISQIQGTISIRRIEGISLPSKLGINIDRIPGSVTVLPASNLSCSIHIISGWLACSIRVIQTTSIQAQITARQKDVSEILGEITVGRGAQNSRGGVMYIPGGFLE